MNDRPEKKVANPIVLIGLYLYICREFESRIYNYPTNGMADKFYGRILVLIFTLFSGFALASSDHAAPEGEKGGFKAGEMIMHHIGDSHDWHIMDLKNPDGTDHPISVPLPIIIYSVDDGFSVFLSSAFHHGTAAKNRYVLDHGHIYRLGENNPYADAEHLDLEEAYGMGYVSEDLAGVFSGTPGAFVDLSITKNAAAILFSLVLLVLIMVSVAKAYQKRPGSEPTGLQNMMETIIVFVRDDIAKSAIGPKYEKFMPFLLSIFFFIWLNNILGLVPIVPGGANVTGNIAVPLVLALFTFVITTINGNAHYWKHIVAMPGVPKPVLLLLTPIEVMQIFIRPIVLMIRLFANITAGHISVLVFFSLIFIFQEKSDVAGWGVSVASVAFTIFLNLLELLVGAIQAYVFTLLSAIYFGMAVAEESH